MKGQTKKKNQLNTTGILPEISEIGKALDDLLKHKTESSASQEKATEEKKTNYGKKENTGEGVKQRYLETFTEAHKRNFQ